MLPYPEIPYGVAPAWCFPTEELVTYALMLLCARRAWKKGAGAMAYLAGGLVFGLLLEYFEVTGSSYVYGRFWLMAGRAPMDVPLCIGCGWAIILYATRVFSDGLGLPLWGAAALDTLMALNIDLSMDVTAYRMHMWHWDWTGSGLNPLRAQWFGIPYGNFVGWITVVFCYSAFSRLFARWARQRGAWRWWVLVCVPAILCSLAVLMGTEMAVFPALIKFAGLTSGRRLLLLTALLLVAAGRGWAKRKGPAARMPALALLVPGWFHLYFTACFFLLGFWRENVWMTAAGCVNLGIGAVAHWWAAAPRGARASLPSKSEEWAEEMS
jgi:hypothetical protein